MRYIVTGGAGYIGSHICKALSEAGHEPVVVDNLSTGNEWSVKWGPLERLDIRDYDKLRRVFERHKPDGVFHFAACAYVGESIENPALYYENNVGGALSLFGVMKETNCFRIVFSSTCATYGVPTTQPISEDTPQNPINPYGQTKLIVEHILRDYDQAYGLRSAALRYFNAAGADPSCEIGEAHDPETHLIPRVLMAVDGTIEYLDVLGTDFPTEDGTAVRDYIHINDLAVGHIQAMKALENRDESFSCNLGTGIGNSVQEVIAAAERVTGKQVPVKPAPRRVGDPPMLVADTTLAQKMIGFVPRYLDIADTIETAWNWHVSRKSPTGSR